MGVPLNEVRKRNGERVAAALDGFENDLLGVLAALPYESLNHWLDLVPGGDAKGVPNALGAAYDASLLFLRRQIAELDLPYLREAVEGIVPENSDNDVLDDAPDDSKAYIDARFVQLTAEEAYRCSVVLRFVAFAVMKARDKGTSMGKAATRAWIAGAFLRVTDITIACIATRLMLELLSLDFYLPPYATLDIFLESALLIPCGTSSSPQAARQSLAQFVESKELAQEVVAQHVNSHDVQKVRRQTSGSDVVSCVMQARLSTAIQNREIRVALVELQIYSLCTLFALASPSGFDELTSKRVPGALSAVAGLSRAPNSKLFSPLKYAIADTLWCVLGIQVDDDWPEAYAARVGLSAQLAALKDVNEDKAYVMRLLSAVSYGVSNLGSSLPSILKIATDAEVPGDVKLIAGNVMNLVVRDDDITPGALRSQNAYTLLVRELRLIAVAVASASTDSEAQLAAGMAEVYAHLFSFWICDARTPELEHALINSDFFEACADLAAPDLLPFLRPRTPAIAIDNAAAILDHSRIEPLVERGTAERFIAALHGLVDADLRQLKSVSNMAEKIWSATIDGAYHELLKHIYQKVLSSPWTWTPTVRTAFVDLLSRSDSAHNDMLVVLDEVLRWAVASDEDVLLMRSGNDLAQAESVETLQQNALSFAFDLLRDSPQLEVAVITKLFVAAKKLNMRDQVLRYYAAQNLGGCVSRFLCDSAETPSKASFLLAVDKVALAFASPFPPSHNLNDIHEDLKPKIVSTMLEGALSAILEKDSSSYSDAVLFVLKDTAFLSDESRMQFICSLMINCERTYTEDPASGNIRQALLFLRHVTTDWQPIDLAASTAYNNTVVSACHILQASFAHMDEPTQTLTFSVLGHIAWRRQPVPLTASTNQEIESVISAALKFEKLRARFVVPAWFGKRDDQSGLTARWKALFHEVARTDPAAVLRLVSSVTDRDFSRHVDGFIAAGDVAVAAMVDGHMGAYVELVSGIANRLQFPWIPFETINWPGAQKALSLVIKEFRGHACTADLAKLFGPFSALMEHALCLTLLEAHERDLDAEEQLSSVRRSPLNGIESDYIRLIDIVKSVMLQLSATQVPDSWKTDEVTLGTISGIAWLLVRLCDSSTSAAKYIIDSGVFAVLVQCTRSDFRPREGTEGTIDENSPNAMADEFADPKRALYRTADPTVAKVMERCLRVVAHAISTAGVVGERKVIMLVDTPRVVGFNQLDYMGDVKSLILRRPELRRAAVRHLVRTPRGLLPASDVPRTGFDIPPLDDDARSNAAAMISYLVPAFLGIDRRMSEVTGDALVDLLSSVGAARDTLLEQYPNIVLQVIRQFGSCNVPQDSRLGGNLRDTHILETAIRFLSVLTVQGHDDPFTLEVRDSLLRSSEKFFAGVVEILRTDIIPDIAAGRKEKAAFVMYFIASALLRASTLQNRIELPIWSQLDADDNVPPFLKAARGSRVITEYLEAYALLSPAALAVRMFRVEVVAVVEEYTILEGYDWPHKRDAVMGVDDESDDNEQHEGGADLQEHHPHHDQISVDRSVFRNSVLGAIDDENADEEDDDEYMEVEDDDDMESVDGLNTEGLSDEADHDLADEDMDFNVNEDADAGDRMSIAGFDTDENDASSSDEEIYLLGGSSGEEDDDEAVTPEVIETVFSSEEGDRDDDSSNLSSDSELDEFDPESPDADTQMSSDVDIVLEGIQPISGFELMNGILLRFGNELEMLDERDIDESDSEEVQPYASSAFFSVGMPEGGREQPVLAENESLLAWWNETTMESSEAFAQVDAYLKKNAPEVSASASEEAIAAVRHRQKNVEPSPRAFGAKRSLDVEKCAATLTRLLYTTIFEQEMMDLSLLLLQLLQFREGRDTIVELVMGALFEASTGNISSSYATVCSLLGTAATAPREATPALVCANCVRLFCEIYESGTSSSPEERENHSRLRRRFSRCLLRNYGPRLVELLAMPQICQNRKLLHNSAVLVLHVFSTLGARRFDSSVETLAQLARVLGLRECTSESFSTLTEIIQKHLRTEVLLPNVIHETRRARSSLLILLPAVARLDVANETVDAFSTEQVKLLRLMSLLNRVYEPQQVLAALKSVNLLPLWHSVGTRLNNGTLDGPTNGRGFASGVSLLESFALALTAAVRWEAPRPDTHPALTQYARWIRSYVQSFMGQRKALINELLRAKPNLYLGPMGEMARTLNLFDFQSKEKWFRAKVEEDASRVHSEISTDFRITIRRQHVLHDSFEALHNLRGPILRAPMLVKFENEEAVDAGGVSREWLELIAREILNPAYALFTATYEGSSVYQVNRDSSINPNHLDYFRVVGRVLGRAVYDSRMIGLYFSRTIYKYLLGRPNVTLVDMEAVDEQYYKSLVWMMEMDVTDVIDETFSVQGMQFGRPFTVDLIDNGRNILVTEDNKKEYVKRIVEYKLVESVKDQLEALRQGFNDVISPDLVELFDEQELELLLCGLPTIRVDDWRANTTYVGYAADSPQVRWFWTAVASFSTEERAKLLQFSTGTSRVPVHGFAHLESSTAGIPFQIHKEHGNTNRWPSSHTCMNQINLPAYESYKKLRTMLLRAIVEGSEGFGFV